MTLPPDATTGGLAFHRLVFARRRSGWWTPLVTGLLAFVIYIVVTVVITVAFVVVALASGADIMADLEDLAVNPGFDLTDPFFVTLLLGTIALMLPSYVVASLIVNGPRLGLISSAAGRLRWRWMLLCGAIAAVISVVLTGLSLLIPSESAGAPAENPLWLATLIVVILLVPVQSAAEEYVFRGYLMQAIGRWLRHPAFAILLPVPLFVLGHLYDPLGQLGVGLFAVAAGWLTWRTGGLEAAIALHVVNNLSAFGLGIFAGDDPTESSVGLISFLWSFLLIGGYVVAVEVLLKRRPLSRTLVLTLPPAPVYAPPVGFVPVYGAPVGYAPGYAPPAGYVPVGDPPTGYVPAGQPQSGYAPAGQPPVAYPAGQPPVGYAPAGQPPVAPEQPAPPAELPPPRWGERIAPAAPPAPVDPPREP